ncbi:hypothetical protein EVAR_25238_1 [Eumeta japonica]|uniref:Uncharacterized protein n=1 Tax=Eumeta variegata TaxID=151549 RepID=A0A4C1WH93_EUMVA|nr:hypothetical protein EVAR_25238_1 [Eumeta japonica]
MIHRGIDAGPRSRRREPGAPRPIGSARAGSRPHAAPPRPAHCVVAQAARRRPHVGQCYRRRHCVKRDTAFYALNVARSSPEKVTHCSPYKTLADQPAGWINTAVNVTASDAARSMLRSMKLLPVTSRTGIAQRLYVLRTDLSTMTCGYRNYTTIRERQCRSWGYETVACDDTSHGGYARSVCDRAPYLIKKRRADAGRHEGARRAPAPCTILWWCE